MTVRTRFAPSPTGYMHIGNLRTALYAYLLARSRGGAFIMRIEDTDRERLVPGAVDLIFKSMELAGFDYDEGPDVGGDYGPYVQSERKATYAPLAWELCEKGGAYPCFCSKARLDAAREAAGGAFKYDGHCKSIPLDEAKVRAIAGENFVIRQSVPKTGSTTFHDAIYGDITVDNAELDDQVLLKSDGLPTYNFANVVDDHLMAITHVMRGNEYLSSTPKYKLLYESFGWEQPMYVHLPPVMKDQTRKLSKRHGDPSFEDLLSQGYLKDAILNYIALLGWSSGTEQEFFTVDELKSVFTLEGLSKSPAIFDKIKLNWFNGEYIKKLPFDEYCAQAQPWLNGIDKERFVRLCELLQGRTQVFNMLPEMIDFLAERPAFSPELYVHKKMKTTLDTPAQVIPPAIEALSAIEDWTEAHIHDTLMALAVNLGVKNGLLLWPVRVALSGKESTPGGAVEIAWLLGKDEAIRRLSAY